MCELNKINKEPNGSKGIGGGKKRRSYKKDYYNKNKERYKKGGKYYYYASKLDNKDYDYTQPVVKKGNFLIDFS
tara:strand:- start:104 stop:325 length:222 start_codon:yes stop_codon:yes gene_type:complete